MKIAVPYEDGKVFQHFGKAKEVQIYTVEGGTVVAAHLAVNDGEVCATIKTAPEDGSHVAATGADALPAGNYRIVESGARRR